MAAPRPMGSRLTECELAVVAILCVLTIFLFPVVQGPYSAVHGPVTALQSLRLRIRWCWAMALAAMSIARLPFSLLASTGREQPWLGPLFSPSFCPSSGSDSSLRC